MSTLTLQEPGATVPMQLPVFIHAMWRTGSTYVWSKFRDQPLYRAYYEPFHEVLSTLSRHHRLMETGEAQAISVASHHPLLRSPYFEEYPCLPNGGVPLFQKSFSYERFCLDKDSSDAALEDYIASLILFAASNGQVPVFQFNRSLLRVGWLIKHFCSINILILRRPVDVWRSFILRGSYYYSSLCLIIGQNQSSPLIAPLARACGIPFFRADNVSQERHYYFEYASRNWLDLYSVFYEFYLLCIICSLPFTDCIIDMDAITGSSACKQLVTEKLKSLGLRISIADCDMPHCFEMSRSEREYVGAEPVLRARLARYLPASLLISEDLKNAWYPFLSEYFNDVLGEFA